MGDIWHFMQTSFRRFCQYFYSLVWTEAWGANYVLWHARCVFSAHAHMFKVPWMAVANDRHSHTECAGWFDAMRFLRSGLGSCRGCVVIAASFRLVHEVCSQF